MFNYRPPYITGSASAEGTSGLAELHGLATCGTEW